MKTSKRVRAKNSAAKVPAQPKTQSPKAESWPLIASREIVAKYYNALRCVKYEAAVSDLQKLGHAIAHHPALEKVSAALVQIGDSDCTLAIFKAESFHIDKVGDATKSEEEIAGMRWFADFYNPLCEKPYINAIVEFIGLWPWIKDNRQFAQITDAIKNLIAADNVLDKFLHEETEKERAR
jgi:hypothetical protein